MTAFMMRFILCNLFLTGILAMFLLVRRLLNNTLSCRMRYNLWYLLPLILTVPFLPFRPAGFPPLFSWSDRTGSVFAAPESGTGGAGPGKSAGWLHDFTVSVTRTPSVIGAVLSAVWITGILAMLFLIFQSFLRLHTLKRASLPLQSRRVLKLYERCLRETGTTKAIPVRSTAFLKSPVIVGLFRPCIYLPIPVVADCSETELRYILLHELQHYRHRDALTGALMYAAVTVYWFHPLLWHALREMRRDRELACDAAVLNLLDEDAYADYGSTLIDFAEKNSRSPFSFTAGLSEGGRQMTLRVLNIAAYRKPTSADTLKSATAFALIACLLLGAAPFLPTCAPDTGSYRWKPSGTVSCTDLSPCFGAYEGSFVLYDLKRDAWQIQNPESASLRTSPDSTYKIYAALSALEAGIITPDDSFRAWDGNDHPVGAWKKDQTLQSAMSASVNWYFEALDTQLGAARVRAYLRKIGYGNCDISGNFPACWLESSLQISPVEQVRLLKKLHENEFLFSPENIRAVRDAIRLSSSGTKTLYGKTGTGRVNGADVNGWFVGFVEAEENTWFFATNISAGEGASGSRAAEITLALLSEMELWSESLPAF